MPTACWWQRIACTTLNKRAKRKRSQIDILHDDVLLEIFDFCVDTGPSLLGIPSDVCKKAIVEEWQLLVHVCRRWRILVLGSPRRLNLRLYCTAKTPIRDTLDVWPALPLIVDVGPASFKGFTMSSIDTDNIIAALRKSNDRISQVDLCLYEWKLEEVFAAMQVPFPELTNLRVESMTQDLIIPDSFLDGSAPRLQYFDFHGLPFPWLPKLLSSATHLVQLTLTGIPRSGYISSEAMAALISVMSGLRILSLEFRYPSPLFVIGRETGENQSSPLPKRSILPALAKFNFIGAGGYLDDLMTRIETPQLDEVGIAIFDPVDFDCAQLAQFIGRSPILRVRDEAHVQFNDRFTGVSLLPRSRTIMIGISCGEPDRQLSSVAQVCNSSFPSISTVKDLYINDVFSLKFLNNGAIENTLWLQLLLPFTAVKNLYLSKESAPGIAAALQELVGAEITEVLPSLQNIFVKGLEPSGPFQESIGQFVAARKLTDRPIAISIRDKDSNMEPLEPM